MATNINQEENRFELRLTIGIPDDVPDDEAVDIIRKLSLAMDEYHRSLGGSGLKIADD